MILNLVKVLYIINIRLNFSETLVLDFLDFSLSMFSLRPEGNFSPSKGCSVLTILLLLKIQPFSSKLPWYFCFFRILRGKCANPLKTCTKKTFFVYLERALSTNTKNSKFKIVIGKFCDKRLNSLKI